MKNYQLALLFYCISFFTSTPVFSIPITPLHTKPISLLIVPIGGPSLDSVAKIIGDDCEFTKQCVIQIRKYSSIPSHQIIKSWGDNYPLALFLTEQKNSIIEWRLYNCLSGRMVIGKRYVQKTVVPSVWAHAISDQLWPHLTGQQPLFSSKIVYCKEIKTEKKGIKKQICIADITGKNEQVIVDSTSLNTAPRFNHDQKNPLIFFSQHTKKNLRLMIIDQDKNQHIASDFDGINMLPAFNSKGNALVYCASRGDGTCHLYYYKPGIFKCLTKNEGRNVSPSFADDSTIYFCSDFSTGNPQIFKYKLPYGTIEKITNDGYCSSPRFSIGSQKLVYSKMIQGTMQLMLFNPLTNDHEQLTTDIGNKEESAWSPCGNYIVYSFEHKNSKRLGIFNCKTRTQRFITRVQEQCSFPDWSPNYEQYPIFS